MALDFPNAPTNGQVYTVTGTGEQWIYEAATNSWTSKGLVNTTGGLQYKGDVNITAAPPAGATSGSQYSVNPGGTANAGFGPGVTGTVAKGSMLMYTGTGWIETSHAVPDATPAVKGLDTRKWDRTGTVLSPATAGDVVNISAGTAALPGLAVVGDAGTGLSSPGPGQLAISTGGSGRLFVDASGNVGINGTINGTAKLQVGGALRLFGSGDGTETTNACLYQASGGGLGIGVNGGEKLRITSAGLVGIGASSPVATNHIRGSGTSGQVTASWILENASSGAVGMDVTGAAGSSIWRFLYTGAGPQTGTNTFTPALTIGVEGAAAGRVGIGDTVPDSALTIKAAAATTPLKVSGPTSEFLRCDQQGRLLVGTSSSSNVNIATFQGNSIASTGTGIVNIALGNASPGANDDLGRLQFTDSGHNSAVQIAGQRDGGTWNTSTSRPSRLVFSTTADGASSPTERMRIHAAGGLSIGRGITVGNSGVAPGDSILFGNTVIASGAGDSALKFNTGSGLVSYDTSSRLVKESIVDCPYGIDALMRLQPRKYFRTDDQREEIGFVADEMVKVMPEFVPIGPKSVITKNEEDTEHIPIGVNYEKLTAVLTKALQEAAAKIETLEARLTAAGIA